MSNIDDIDYTLNLLAQKRITDRKIDETIKGTEEAITRLEQEEAKPYLGWYGPDGKPLNEEQYRKMMDMFHKSTTKSEILTTKATIIDKATKFINKNKATIAGTLAAATLAITTLGATWGPSLKANKQMNDLSDNFGEELVEMNYCKQQDNIFSDFELTISPNRFVNNLGLTADSHMRLYILSTVLQQTDFERILWELGYNNLDSYVKKLGFEHGDLRAGENYQIEYEKKLKKLIMDLNKNPEKIDEYLDIYPELGFIYDPDNTILTAEGIGTTRTHGGR